MITVDIKEMMEAGAHFGHQTKRWNPKMKSYIYGARSGVHILDLQKTATLAFEALKFITNGIANGQNILFVGTKQQARDVVREAAANIKMHYVNQRWMGGTLTNFKTIKKSIDRLIDWQTKRTENTFEGYTKKELLDIDREITKLEASLGGIKSLKDVPDMVFVIDPRQEYIAVSEAKKLGIPVIAITDSNCDPEPIDFVIPANDDARLSIEYFVNKVAQACVLGQEKFEENARNGRVESIEARKARGNKPRKPINSKGKTAYVARDTQGGFEGDAQGEFSVAVEKSEQAAS